MKFTKGACQINSKISNNAATFVGYYYGIIMEGS